MITETKSETKTGIPILIHTPGNKNKMLNKFFENWPSKGETHMSFNNYIARLSDMVSDIVNKEPDKARAYVKRYFRDLFPGSGWEYDQTDRDMSDIIETIKKHLDIRSKDISQKNKTMLELMFAVKLAYAGVRLYKWQIVILLIVLLVMGVIKFSPKWFSKYRKKYGL